MNILATMKKMAKFIAKNLQNTLRHCHYYHQNIGRLFLFTIRRNERSSSNYGPVQIILLCLKFSFINIIK